jgi:hypothetical protein
LNSCATAPPAISTTVATDVAEKSFEIYEEIVRMLSPLKITHYATPSIA